MDAKQSVSWNSLAWVPYQPSGKELPNSGQSESSYAYGNANMTSNRLLLHMDETSWSTAGAITNSSPQSNNGTATNATPSSFGRFNNAGSFNGTSAYVTLSQLPTSGTGSFTIEGWVRSVAQGTAQTMLAYGNTTANEGVIFGIHSPMNLKLTCLVPPEPPLQLQ